MKKILSLKSVVCLLTLGVLTLGSCDKDNKEPEKPKRTEKEITAFSIPTLNITGVIDAAKHEITLTVAPDYEMSNLVGVVPQISYNGLSIEPLATAAQDFTKDVTYTVTAEDASTQAYTVKLVLSPFKLGIATMKEVWKQEDWAGLGFAPNSENTMALLGDKLVASRSGIVLNAADGTATGAKLDTTGTTGKFHKTNTVQNYPFAVTNDDAGNMIGVALGAWTKPNNPIYKWTAVDQAPTLVYELVSDTLVQFGRKIYVTGDINGSAWIAQYNHAQGGAKHDGKQYVWKVTGGTVNPEPTVVTGRTPVDNSYYQAFIPMTTASLYPYYVGAFGSSSTNPPSGIGYQKDQSSEIEWITGFQNPETDGTIVSSAWGAYVYHAKKFTFNDKAYIAIVSISAFDNINTFAIYYLTILDTETNTVVERVDIPIGTAATNGNGTASVTAGPEQDMGDGEKRIRLYMLLTNKGVYCHELSNKVAGQ